MPWIAGGIMVFSGTGVFGQGMHNKDTILTNKKDIDKIVFYENDTMGFYGSKAEFYDTRTEFKVQTFKNKELISMDFFRYSNNKLSFYRRIDIDEFGRIVTKEDTNGDGTIDWSYISDYEKKILLVDFENDGIFEETITDAKFYSNPLNFILYGK